MLTRPAQWVIPSLLRSALPLVALGVALAAAAAPEGGAWTAVALAFAAAMVPAVDLLYAVLGRPAGPAGWRLSEGAAASTLLAAVALLVLQLDRSLTSAMAIAGIASLAGAGVALFFIRRMRRARSSGLTRREVRLLGWVVIPALGLFGSTIAAYASAPTATPDPRSVGLFAWVALPLLPLPWALAGSARPGPAWARPAAAVVFGLAAVIISVAGRVEVLALVSAAGVAAIGGWAALETATDTAAPEPPISALYAIVHAVSGGLALGVILFLAAIYLIFTVPV